MEKDTATGGWTGRRKGRTEETTDSGSGTRVEEKPKPTCGSDISNHTHLSEWTESGRWVQMRTHTHTQSEVLYIHMYIYYNHTCDGFITWADWQISLAVFYVCLSFWQSHTHTHSQTHSLSLSHTFIHSCSPPSGALKSGAMYQTPITTHSLPASQPHTYTQLPTVFFFFPLPTGPSAPVQALLFLFNRENL